MQVPQKPRTLDSDFTELQVVVRCLALHQELISDPLQKPCEFTTTEPYSRPKIVLVNIKLREGTNETLFLA